jgi:hypothetical protein
MQQFLSIPQSPRSSQVSGKEKGLDGPHSSLRTAREKQIESVVESIFTRNGATKKMSRNRLKWTWISVLLSNPLTKDVFPIHLDRSLVYVVVSLRDWTCKNPARRSPATSTELHLPFRRWSTTVAVAVSIAVFSFAGSVWLSRTKKTWNQIQEGNYACHSSPRRPPY